MVKLFIVEDNPVYLKFLENHFINYMGYNVKSFTNGEDCLDNIYQEPDYVILDYYLNEENPDAITGEEVFNKIKDKSDHTIVIMLSGQQNGELVLKLVRNGLRDYVIKDEGALNEIQNIIEGYEQEKEYSVSS